mmetsp:Transcript_22403/g.42865  ORF Transcript_22403/g.42865 Transcript_22403/m.42865 type:complete len:287 (-) Transcript_22403:162-1022(-)
MEIVCSNGLSIGSACGFFTLPALAPALVPVTVVTAGVALKNRKVIKRGLKRALTGGNARTAVRMIVEELAMDGDSSRPQQSLMSFAQQRTSRVPDERVTETVNRLMLVGMQKQRCVCRNELPKDQLEPWLRRQLLSNRFPQVVIDAVASNAGHSKDLCKMEEDFSHTTDGQSHLYKYGLWIQERDATDVLVAFMGSNATFQSARIIEDWLIAMEPMFHGQEKVEEAVVDGLLGSFRQPRTVMRRRQIGERPTRTPIYRQQVMNPADGDAIREFMEYQACLEVLEMG